MLPLVCSPILAAELDEYAEMAVWHLCGRTLKRIVRSQVQQNEVLSI